MKCLVTHDRAGNIAGLLASPPDAPPVVVTPQRGLFLTEVEVPDHLLDVSGPDGENRFAEILRQYQIQGTGEGKLVKRSSPREKR